MPGACLPGKLVLVPGYVFCVEKLIFLVDFSFSLSR